MAVLIPLILLFVYIAYKFVQKKQKEKEDEEQEALNYEAQKKLVVSLVEFRFKF